jgi:predicted DNA-binding transcriptional regulator AlpA
MYTNIKEDDTLLPSSKVRQRFGGVSDMTLWRWERNEKLGFPKPVRINARRYYRLSELDEFEQRQRAKQAANAA